MTERTSQNATYASDGSRISRYDKALYRTSIATILKTLGIQLRTDKQVCTVQPTALREHTVLSSQSARWCHSSQSPSHQWNLVAETFNAVTISLKICLWKKLTATVILRLCTHRLDLHTWLCRRHEIRDDTAFSHCLSFKHEMAEMLEASLSALPAPSIRRNW